MSNFNNDNDKENFFLSIEHTSLEQYEDNELMHIVINDLQQFFSSAICTCHNKKEKCFEKVG
ncbi:3010_t:CDS:1, partial [Funneliformis caledonium]